MLISLGAKRILTKPINFEELLNELRSCIPIGERRTEELQVSKY
jgi:DNA-binding response OmpR family regulator